MRTNKHLYERITLTALLFAVFSAGSIAQDASTIDSSETKTPTILATNPSDGEMNVNQNSVIEITFSNEMDAASINSNTLLLHATYADTLNEEFGEMQHQQISDNYTSEYSEKNREYTTDAVKGTISYSNKTAVFTPDGQLKKGAQYTFTVTNGVKNSENIALENDKKWSFTTTGAPDLTYSDKKSDKKNDRSSMEESENRSVKATSPNKKKAVDLGKAGEFVILAKKDVNNESGSKITGHVGEGSEAEKNKGDKDTPKQNNDQKSDQSDMTSSPNVTEAIDVLESTFSNVSMHESDVEVTNHNTKSFHHDPALKPGVHVWDSSIDITSDVTLSGDEDDVWIFKTGDDLTVSENTVITLADGAQADNIYWYVEGEASIGKNAEFEGIVLSMDEITLEEGAIVNGRMFSQSSITLDDNTITEPRKMTGKTTSKNKDKEDR